MTDRWLQLSLSKDGAHTWGDWTLHRLQDEGQYTDPMPVRRRCGISRQFVLKGRVTSPVNVTFIAMATEASGES